MLSSIPSYLGQMHLRSGNHKKGLECLQKSLGIRLQEKDGDEMEVSWAEHNIGEAYITMHQLELAHSWLERAADTWERWSATPSTTPRRAFSPFQRMIMASCLLYMGRLDESRLVLAPSLAEYLGRKEDWTNAA